MKIYSVPKVDRAEAAKKMLLHCLFAFLALSAAVTALLINISKDSEMNKDAVRKITSEATEMWAVITFIVFVAAIVYLSVTGVALSHRIRKQFSNLVYYKSQLYLVSASVPCASVNADNHVSRIMKIQDKALEILNDEYTLTQIIENKIVYGNIRAVKVTSIEKIIEKKYGLDVYFDNFKIRVSNKTDNFDELADILKGYLIQ
ncbi:MAG: hypothetical protein ACI4JF_10265 [Oscillospiraceae bacterium]